MADWDALMSNTREDAMRRREICFGCDHWMGDVCKKWECRSGRDEPWLAVHGVCPLQKWVVGRTKGIDLSKITGQDEDKPCLQ